MTLPMLWRKGMALVVVMLTVSSSLSAQAVPVLAAEPQSQPATQAASAKTAVLQLMPMPATSELTADSWLTLPRALVYQLQGPVDAPMLPALALLQQLQPSLQLAQQTALQPAAQNRIQLQISYQQFIALPTLGDDESYQLQINPGTSPANSAATQQTSPNAIIQLSAKTSTGVLYGLMTLSQLLRCEQGAAVCQVPAVRISDQPRFGWRGLLLDSARRFIPLADIRRTLDGMAAAKLNVLHWHLTDDQAWRLESTAYPKLQQHSAQGEYYRQQEVRALVQYAAARGIRVVPELDVPGHAWAIGQAYPELLAWPDGEAVKVLPPQRGFGVFPAVLDPSKPAVWQFLTTLIQEWTALFPDAYLHIGGDEVKPDHWLASSAVRAYMATHQLADAPALQAFFNRQLADLLLKAKRHMVGWDEILHPDLPAGTVVQSWQGQDALGAAVRAGHPALLSAGFYVDMPQHAAYHWRNDPLTVTTPLPAVPATAKAKQWALLMQRLNNKPLQGNLRLYQQSADVWQASLEFNGRGAVPMSVQQLVAPARLLLQADTFLGPVAFELPVSQLLSSDFAAAQPAASYNGDVLVGNHRYGVQLSPVGYQPLPLITPLDQQAQQLLWGGEATLWTELASPELLDMKLWPRLFVVAEQFWSNAAALDAPAMPALLASRLAALDDYSSKIGLLHKVQQQNLLNSFTADAASQRALQGFSQYLQPLHYYGRHHIKTAAGRYNLDEPLDKLADALLIEPPALLSLQQAFVDAPACQLPASWGQYQAQFAQFSDALQGYQGKHAGDIQQLLAGQQQLVKLLNQWGRTQAVGVGIGVGVDAPREKQLALLQQTSQQLQQPKAEQVLALAGIVDNWLQRCAQPR